MHVMSGVAVMTLAATLAPVPSPGAELAQEEMSPHAAQAPVTEDVDLRQPQAGPAESTTIAPSLPAPQVPSAEDSSVQTESAMHRLDIGATVGFNNPGGIYGAETDFRLIDRFSVGLAGGQGAWGVRLTPQVRLYPFRIHNAGLFLESGLSLNLGGKATASVDDTVVQEADLAFTPVANVSLGYRISSSRWSWWAIRVGYGFRLKQDNYRLREASIVDPLMEPLISASQPGGLLLGVSGGFSTL